MMSDWMTLSLAAMAGCVLGGFYFASLWWVVRRLPTASHPARWLILSYGLRISITLAGFYWVMDGRWERAAACLVGFVLVRVLLVRHIADHGQAIITR